jgi:exodeoxyribonuclease V alpha subunit
MALTNTVSILTGGPGCGKTFTVRLIAQLAKQAGATVALAAPTGRAAKRLSDLTSMPAMTVHRMIRPRTDPSADGALFDQDDLAQADLIVVDETSMLDLRLACALTEKIASGAHLLFVGDPYQLPSIGAGNVLHDLLEVPGIPRVALTRIFRQAHGSTIITNAHLVRRGQMPRIHGHFYRFHEEHPEAIANLVTDIATRQIPERFGAPASDIQVLCPTSKGPAGATELNRRLQDRLNPALDDPREHWAEGRVFRAGDKVMPIRNRYDKGTAGVFNGASATITRLIQDEQRIEILTDDGETISYDHDELDELLHAYAVTVHRSQGSQYPWVVIPLSTAAGALMLQRRLLYTAITRAEHAIVIVGQHRALEMAVERTGTRRNTALTRRLGDRLIHIP